MADNHVEFNVTEEKDNGLGQQGTLLEAIDQANKYDGTEAIVF